MSIRADTMGIQLQCWYDTSPVNTITGVRMSLSPRHSQRESTKENACLRFFSHDRQPFRCIYHCHPRHEKKKAVLLIKGQTQYKDFQQHFLKTESISQQRLGVHHKSERWDQRLLATQYFILSFHFLYLFKTNNYWSWLHCSRTFGF